MAYLSESFPYRHAFRYNSSHLLSAFIPFMNTPPTFETLHNLRGISFGALNIRSTVRKLDDVKLLLSKSKLDYLCLNKTWLNSSIDNCEHEIRGYNLHRFDRDDGSGRRGGGGIMTYSNAKCNFKSFIDWNLCSPDLKWTSVKLHQPRTRPTFI